ncbi:hypothetical protein GBA52_002314 [Prunus armeniaca]|nr:hypothetical protein GBA52_002314 [Prunus armeniaca]
MAAASSSIPFFGSTGSREETQGQMTSTLQQHSSATPSSNTTAAAVAPPPQKKRRNQPGNPKEMEVREVLQEVRRAIGLEGPF